MLFETRVGWTSSRVSKPFGFPNLNICDYIQLWVQNQSTCLTIVKELQNLFSVGDKLLHLIGALIAAVLYCVSSFFLVHGIKLVIKSSTEKYFKKFHDRIFAAKPHLNSTFPTSMLRWIHRHNFCNSFDDHTTEIQKRSKHLLVSHVSHNSRIICRILRAFGGRLTAEEIQRRKIPPRWFYHASLRFSVKKIGIFDPPPPVTPFS